MYVLRTRFFTVAGRDSYRDTLMEMTKSELEKARAEATARPSLKAETRYRIVDRAYANQYVMDGGHHETTLWVDGRRVRKA